ncbi:hypothetical protein [Legionella spiritensis]|uniref:Uncharacterized protein n=1 Tax=Legionella spiritensis TaxID=452 RepID=A0A0W0ZA49_LEGSP|nr:hypothetical protein [Legionella spiritensis]KTD65811.1 hypothetical protein Lspi_0523 [Legionella spiritensis]SNV41181.1 Uncharacterised protein [Legionella spiritensis]
MRRYYFGIISLLWLFSSGLAFATGYQQVQTLSPTIPGSPFLQDNFGANMHYNPDSKELFVGAVVGRAAGVVASGVVYVYRKSGQDWTLAQTITTEGLSDHFGAFSIKTIGNWLFIPCIGTPAGPYPGEDITNQDFTGSIRIYHKDVSGQYVFVQALDRTTPGLENLTVIDPAVLTPPSPPPTKDFEQGAAFGLSFDLDEEGDNLLVGAATQQNTDGTGSPLINSGAVYAFKREHNKWVLKQTIQDPEGPVINGSFGGVVKISGHLAAISTSTVFVNMRFDVNSKVFLYEYNDELEKWEHVDTVHGDQTNLLPLFAPTLGGNIMLGDNFGASLAFWNKWLIVGAPFEHMGSGQIKGAAYLYRVKHAGAKKELELEKKIVSDDANALMTGFNVALQGKTALVSDLTHTGPFGQTAQGGILVYKRHGNNWYKDITLFDENGGAFDLFSNGVEVHHNLIFGGTGSTVPVLFLAFFFDPPFLFPPLPLQENKVVIWKRTGH